MVKVTRIPETAQGSRTVEPLGSNDVFLYPASVAAFNDTAQKKLGLYLSLN